LAVMDCYAKQLLSREQWSRVTAQKEKELMSALDEIAQEWSDEDNKPKFEPAQHVAIDRWTGGSAESMLFSTLEPHGIAWEPIVLMLDLEPRRNAEKETDRDWRDKDAALALLFLLLRDLAAGRVPLGFAVNRGMGEIEVESIEFKGRGLRGDLSALQANRLVLEGGKSLFSELGAIGIDFNSLNNAWKDWREHENAT
ncbi:MAG: hypothetical protein ACREBC_21270, partial [Pyrinomonadaceae bacterium]